MIKKLVSVLALSLAFSYLAGNAVKAAELYDMPDAVDMQAMSLS